MLRFDHQTCDWSMHELSHIDWATVPNAPLDEDSEDSDGKKAKKKQEKKARKESKKLEKKEKKKKVKKEDRRAIHGAAF